MILKKKVTKSFISILLSLAMIVSGLTFTTSKVSAAEKITSITVTGIPLPTAGATAKVPTIGVPADANYTAQVDYGDSKPWFDEQSFVKMETTDTFLAGETYSLDIFFKPKAGYEMDDISQITVNLPELCNTSYTIHPRKSGASLTDVSVTIYFTVHTVGENLVSCDANGGYLLNGNGGMNTTGHKLIY